MNVTFTFEKILAAFVDPKIRGVASKGGTRSGKTWATLQMLHILASEQPTTARYLVCGGYVPYG